MKINFTPYSNNFFNSTLKIKKTFYMTNFGKNQNGGDSFSLNSGYLNQPKEGNSNNKNIDLLQEIINARNSGELRKDTCTRLGIKENQYKKFVRENNLPKRRNLIITEEIGQQIKKLLSEGKNYGEIANILNISRGLIKNTVLRHSDLYKDAKRPKPRKEEQPEYQNLLNEIIQARKSGELRSDTCVRLGIKENKYRTIIKENNLPKRKHILITEEKKRKIKELLAKGKSYREISAIVNLPETVVYDTVRRNPDIHKIKADNKKRMKEQVQKEEEKKLENNRQKEELKVILKNYEDEINKIRATLANCNAAERIITSRKMQDLTQKINEIKKKIFKLDGGMHVFQEEVDYNTLKLKKREIVCNSVGSINRNTAKLSSTDDLSKIYNYIMQIKKNDLDVIMSKYCVAQEDFEEQIKELNNLQEEIRTKKSNYPDTTKENKVLQTLIEDIERRKTSITKKKEKAANSIHGSSLKNPKWLEKNDFDRKLFSHQKLIDISKIAQCEDFEIEEANKKLQKAYPEECVIFIDDYDSMNTNNPNEQKHTILGKFYESLDGKTTGRFCTNKKFIIEFLSDRKHLYKNFIDSLILNRKKIVGA